MLVKAKFHFPEIAVGILFAVALFAMGMTFASRQYPPNVQIEHKDKSTSTGQGQQRAEKDGTIIKQIDAAQEAVSNFEAKEISIFGVKPGEALLAFFTLMLWLATRRLVQGADKNAVAELRAYVQIHDIDAFYEMPKNGRAKIRVFVYWQNTGQTPTRQLKWAIDHRLGALPSDFAFDLSANQSKGIATIGAGGITRDVSHEIDRTGLDAFDRSEQCVTVFGSVEYSDVFPPKKRHRTEFCIEIRRENGVTIQNFTADRHNGADDECIKPAGFLDLT